MEESNRVEDRILHRLVQVGIESDRNPEIAVLGERPGKRGWDRLVARLQNGQAEGGSQRTLNRREIHLALALTEVGVRYKEEGAGDLYRQVQSRSFGQFG